MTLGVSLIRSADPLYLFIAIDSRMASNARINKPPSARLLAV